MAIAAVIGVIGAVVLFATGNPVAGGIVLFIAILLGVTWWIERRRDGNG